MLKRITAGIVAIMLVFSLAGCRGGNDAPTPPPSQTQNNQEGSANVPPQQVPPQSNAVSGTNGVGNIINLGLVAVLDDWIYFSVMRNFPTEFAITSPDSFLYKMRIDGSDRQLLAESEFGVISNINVVGDWIYCVKRSFGTTTIERVRTDNTELQVLLVDDGRIWDLSVVDDWLYFRYSRETNESEERQWLGRKYHLSRISIDGTDRKDFVRFSNDPQTSSTTSENVLISGGYIFAIDYGLYGDIHDDLILGLHRVSIGDLEELLLQHEITGITLTFLTRMDEVEANQVLAFNEVSIESFNVAGNWVYFICSESNVWKIRTDGTEKTQLFETPYPSSRNSAIYVFGNLIFCVVTDGNNNPYMFMIRTDGTGFMIIDEID